MFQLSGSPQAEALAVAPPSPGLAAMLDQVLTEELDDAALVELVAAWRRLQSWAAARAARAAEALSRRASMNPLWPDVAGNVSEPCVAAEELAMRLGCSRRSARDLVRAGVAYEGALWPTGDALERGDLDESKARVLLTALVPVPGELAIAVQEEVLPTAPRRTPAQLAGDVQRALIRVDPDEAAERAARAVEERRVCRPRVLPNGMAGIWAVLPAPAAVALHEELGAVARAARRAGDSRTIDQLRADALCGALLGRGAAQGAQGALPDGPGGAPGNVDDPLLRILQAPPLRAEVRVVVPLDALLGVADGAAELEGYGPVPPATAEALARDGTWRRLVTDPLSGTVLDVGRTRYRPPAGLEAHVRTRDGTCVRPGCSTPAVHCEVDHTVPFGPVQAPGSAEDGPTAHDNLGCLCKREHLLKTHAGFVLRQVAPGVFEWTTPTGHRYVERRTALDGGVPVELSVSGQADAPVSAGRRVNGPGGGVRGVGGGGDRDRRAGSARGRSPGEGVVPVLPVPGRPVELQTADGRRRNSAFLVVRPHRRDGSEPVSAGDPPF